MTLRQIDPTHLMPGLCRTHPSIAVHNGERYVAYRIESDPPNRRTKSAVCYCDENWNPIPYTSKLLEVNPPINDNGDSVFEDVRLAVIKNKLAFCGTNRERMCWGWHWGGHVWEEKEPTPQKNWTMWDDPFSEAMSFHKWPTDQRVPDSWEYGNEPHGGTPLIKYHDWHVGFFHSHLETDPLPPPLNHPSDVALGGGKRRIYFGSPYARRGTDILFPTQPLLWPRLYGASLRAPNNHSVVFPCGLVREGDHWLVSFGDDKDCWLAEFSTREIWDVLKPL